MLMSTSTLIKCLHKRCLDMNITTIITITIVIGIAPLSMISYSRKSLNNLANKTFPLDG